jgi:glucokinase
MNKKYLTAMSGSYLAIDLGGTKCAGAIISDEGKIRIQKKIRIAGLAGDDAGDAMIELCAELLDHPGLKDVECKGIGISVPGISYKERGTVWAPNIPGWEDYPLRDKIQHSLRDSLPVSIENDRACSIMGEYWLGAARGCKNAIHLAFGTGIGAGIIADGRVLRGQSDIAGSVGWLALDDQYPEGYRQYGCFEYNASGDGLSRLANDLYRSDKRYHNSMLQPGKMDAAEIFEAWEQNDTLALEVMKTAIQYWGKGVANLVSIFNPEIIIFGGGLFGPALQFLKDIYQEATKYAQPIAIKEVVFCPGVLGAEAQLFGAVKIRMNEL